MTLAQTDVSKDKIVTNTAKEVMAELKKEAAQELVKPILGAENQKDAEPTNVQISK